MSSYSISIAAKTERICKFWSYKRFPTSVQICTIFIQASKAPERLLVCNLARRCFSLLGHLLQKHEFRSYFYNSLHEIYDHYHPQTATTSTDAGALQCSALHRPCARHHGFPFKPSYTLSVSLQQWLTCFPELFLLQLIG